MVTYRIANLPYFYTRSAVVALLIKGGLNFDAAKLRFVRHKNYDGTNRVGAGYVFLVINGEEDARIIRRIVDPIAGRQLEAVPYIAKES